MTDVARCCSPAKEEIQLADAADEVNADRGGVTGSAVDVYPIAVAMHPTHAQRQHPSQRLDQTGVAGRRAVPAEKPARSAHHPPGTHVIARLVPRAHQAALRVDVPLAEIGELVTATP